MVVSIAEITLRTKRINPALSKMGIAWSHDVMRHSAASYLLERAGGDGIQVATWLGPDKAVLHENYKGLVTVPADAQEWFSIRL
jgi:hypothetical protein